MPAELPAFDATQNYFAALGLPEKLLNDPAQLQKIFYDRSRKLHPDRFVTASEEQKKLSLLWSAQLNEAYNTLKDFHAAIEYILKLKAVPETGKNQMPMELSEAFFEAQESGDNTEFSKLLDGQLTENESQLKTLAADWDKTQKQEILKKIREQFDLYRYLTSMKRNLSGKFSHE